MNLLEQYSALMKLSKGNLTEEEKDALLKVVCAFCKIEYKEDRKTNVKNIERFFGIDE